MMAVTMLWAHPRQELLHDRGRTESRWQALLPHQGWLHALYVMQLCFLRQVCCLPLLACASGWHALVIYIASQGCSTFIMLMMVSVLWCTNPFYQHPFSHAPAVRYTMTHDLIHAGAHALRELAIVEG